MRLLPLLGCLFWISHASGSDCRAYGALTYRESPQCQCSNFPKELKSFSPFRNLKLVAACDYQTLRIEGKPEFSGGELFFRGEQLFSGLLKRRATEFDYEIRFKGERIKQQPPFYYEFVELVFSDERTALKKFKPPKFNSKVTCWEANVSIKVTEMKAMPSGNIQEGFHPIKYSVMSVGPYRQCPDELQSGAHL